MNMKDRVSMAEIFSKYIPDFEYELIQIHDFTTLELVEKGNGLSLIMLVNQLKSAEDFTRLQEIPSEYFENLEKKSSMEILRILSQVMTLLLRRLNVPIKEIHSVTDKIWKGEIDMMFDSFQGYDVQKVRRESFRAGEARGDARGITAMISDNLEENVSEERIIKKLKKHFLLDEQAAKEYLEKYYVING